MVVILARFCVVLGIRSAVLFSSTCIFEANRLNNVVRRVPGRPGSPGLSDGVENCFVQRGYLMRLSHKQHMNF